MPFARPTLPILRDRIIADIEARLPGAQARLAFSNLGVLALVEAGAVHGLYGFLDYLSKQLFIQTSEAEFLEMQAAQWKLTRVPAAAASGPITLTGTNGVTVPTGTLFQRSDGVQYVTIADATIASGTATANVVASVGSAASNTLAGITLNIVSPIAGINSAATVASGGLVSGADIETDEALRARLLFRIQTPPQGGALADYVAWALEVPGVTRVWPTSIGDGTVSVRFVRDNDVSIIPDAGEVAAVQAYLDIKRPVTAQVIAIAPTPKPINFTISVTPNTAAVKAAVTAELTDLLNREGSPGNTILLSHIRAAISLATGETDYTLTLPSANVGNAANDIATMGTITWL